MISFVPVNCTFSLQILLERWGSCCSVCPWKANKWPAAVMCIYRNGCQTRKGLLATSAYLW